jgi:hypothetical protein
MPYDSESGLYERRSTTVIDASPDGDTVYIAIDAKLDLAADDTVIDLNHHAANGNHYPATSTADDSRFLRQSPSGTVSWANGVVAADAALKDMSNVASGAIAPAKVAQDASNRFMTDTERTKLSDIAASAEVNQNAFSNVAVSGQTTCAADTKTDTLTLVGGTGVTITTNATTDTVTITGADSTPSAKGIIEIATEGETTGLSDTARAIVPANLLAGVKTAINASGSAPIYACRAFVNFNGIPASITPNASGNVSSVTKNGAGDYTINFATALPAANYTVHFGQTGASTINMGGVGCLYGAYDTGAATKTTSAVRFQTFVNTGNSGMTDYKEISVSIFI